jgi:hypothetical protein
LSRSRVFEAKPKCFVFCPAANAPPGILQKAGMGLEPFAPGKVLTAMAGSLDAVAARIARDAAQPLAVLLMAVGLRLETMRER